jgi:hypothetical protein
MSAPTKYADYLADLAKFKPWFKPRTISATPTEIVSLAFYPDGHRLSVRKRPKPRRRKVS